MRLLRCIAAAGLLLRLAPGASAGWGGCVSPAEDADDDGLVTIGKKTYVCLNVANSSDWTAGVSYQRLSLAPQADQYSRLRIPGCKCVCVALLLRRGAA